MPAPTNRTGLRPGGPGYREGRIQKAVRRVLIAEGAAITTTAMMEAVWMRGKPWTEWRWAHVRTAAERHAERVWPRTRPLRWRAKTDVPSARKQKKSKT